jgi:MFS-type transporter involved in bile tolerance (Atg22 family)
MLGSAITINLAFLAHGFAVYALIVPFALFVGNMWLGPAVATLQDVVLPRMRGIAAATSSIGSTMVGFGLGPYLSGKISGLTGSLKTGVLSLYLILPVSLLLFWLISRRIGDLEATRVARAVAAGEVIAPGCDPP